jgi:glucosyl-3-phosphoglycerate synthase
VHGTPAQRWLRDRSFHHSAFDAAALAGAREQPVSVCLPARECAGTVGRVVEELVALRELGLIDEIVVVDAASADGTAAVAAAAGATVVQESELLPEFGPVLGKGDAMWRALSALEGDLVCYLDADTVDFSRHFAVGMLGPLIELADVSFVKASYSRPFTSGAVSLPDGGGRVSQLTARPALALFYPDLAGVRQPLAGEIAARREVLERLPFTTGYGVEIAMLIDVFDSVGLDAIAQVDLDLRQNSHQSLAALAPMALAVLRTIAIRLRRDGRLDDFADSGLLGEGNDYSAPAIVERPPLATLRAAR